jgi:hypothetical protein
VIHKCVQVRHAQTAARLGVDMISMDGFECECYRRQHTSLHSHHTLSWYPTQPHTILAPNNLPVSLSRQLTVVPVFCYGRHLFETFFVVLSRCGAAWLQMNSCPSANVQRLNKTEPLTLHTNDTALACFLAS